MAEPTEYRIETLVDMLDVPPEKWDAMLADIRAWLEMRRSYAPLAAAGLIQFEPYAIWIDDGITGLRRLELEIDHG